MENLMNLIKQQSEQIRESFFRIMLDSMKLELLEQGGVDNWEWFGESLNPDDEPPFEEKEEDLKKELGL